MKIFIFDSESYQNQKGNPEFGLAIAKEFNKDNFIYFYNKEDAKSWILYGKPKIVYIHYGLQFDLELIFGYRDLAKYDLKFSNGKLVYAKINNTQIVDTYLLFHASLKEIGKNIGILKGELQEELAVMQKEEFEKRKDEIEEYCKNDVIILENALKWLFDFAQKYGIIRYTKYITIASLSFALISKQSNIRFTLLNDKGKITKVINPMHNLFKLSYYGGRTEAIFIGNYDGPIYVYDFNSLYPSCFSYPFPNKFLYAKINPSDEELSQILIGEYEGLGFFEIYAPKGVFGFFYNDKFIDIGILPFKDKKEHKIIYPVGYFYGWYNFNEIRYAISHGYKIKAHSIYVYDRIYYNSIYETISKFYKLRKEDKANSPLYKLMINSFYGKFGEKHQNEIYISPDDIFNISYDYENYKYKPELDENNKIKYVIAKEKKYSLSNHTDFSIASYITSHARIQLLEKFYQIIKHNGLIFYCDTDSIFTNISLPSDENLGGIKLDKEGIHLKIHGQKNYTIINKNGEIFQRKKGITKDAHLIEKLDDEDETEIYEYDHILPFKSGIKKYDELTKVKEIKKIKNTFKRQKGKGFLQALELNLPNVLQNENIKWKFDNLKELFDYLNIKYPYDENFEIHYY
ncbi:MAG: DNA polymerase [Candidatus Micrarchaeaceae archaeon]